MTAELKSLSAEDARRATAFSLTSQWRIPLYVPLGDIRVLDVMMSVRCQSIGLKDCSG